MASGDSMCVDAFVACREATQRAVLIKRVSRLDKEFHFQRRVSERPEDAGFAHDATGCNPYPDFTLVHDSEGNEVKGLKRPGREASYDSNSQVCTGRHNESEIYYVFGRYRAGVDNLGHPVKDRPELVGELVSIEADQVVMPYTLDLTADGLTSGFSDHPSAGRQHFIVAYRMKGIDVGTVTMVTAGRAVELLDLGDD